MCHVSWICYNTGCELMKVIRGINVHYSMLLGRGAGHVRPDSNAEWMSIGSKTALCNNREKGIELARFMLTSM